MTLNSTPLVTVVIPSYNHELYVRQAIQSVINQTYKNIELIIIDDSSQDSTFFIAKGLTDRPSCKDRFYNVSVFRHEQNAGAHSTINEGISYSSGDYVTILNSDDYFAESRIERIVTDMIRNASDLGFSLTQPVDKNSYPIDQKDLPNSLSDAFHYIRWAKNALPTISFAFLARNVAISTGNIVFSKSLYKNLGGFRDYKYIHDWDFALRACLLTEPTFVDKVLYFYRLHASNSFSSLADIGEIEIDDMTRKFFSGVHGEIKNGRAPVSRLWPGCLEIFEEELYLVRRARSLGVTV